MLKFYRDNIFNTNLQIIQWYQVEKLIKQLLLQKNPLISPPPEQLSVLHDLDEVDDPEHSCPPGDGPFWVLERVLMPPPHVLVHDPHEPQEFQVQSTEK